MDPKKRFSLEISEKSFIHENGLEVSKSSIKSSDSDAIIGLKTNALLTKLWFELPIKSPDSAKSVSVKKAVALA